MTPTRLYRVHNAAGLDAVIEAASSCDAIVKALEIFGVRGAAAKLEQVQP